MAPVRGRKTALEFKDLAAFYVVPNNEKERSTPPVFSDMGNARFHVVKGTSQKTRSLSNILRSTDLDHGEKIIGDAKKKNSGNKEHATYFAGKLCKDSSLTLLSSQSKTCSKKIENPRKAGSSKCHWKKFRSLSEIMKTTGLHQTVRRVEFERRKTGKVDQEQHLLADQVPKRNMVKPYQLIPTKGI